MITQLGATTELSLNRYSHFNAASTPKTPENYGFIFVAACARAFGAVTEMAQTSVNSTFRGLFDLGWDGEFERRGPGPPLNGGARFATLRTHEPAFHPYCTKFANDRKPAFGIGPKTGGAGRGGESQESGDLSLFLEERGRKIESFQSGVDCRLNIPPIHMLWIGQIRLNKLAAAFGGFGGVGDLIEHDFASCREGSRSRWRT
ncbi:hypothetical protein DXT96_25455 [Agrobacterium sp. ICMP 6402]|nr:hypothetical protein [Agrobacterium sp. ICMP 6402]